MSAEAPAEPIVFFDGECNLCNVAVDFCLRYEASPVLRFAALQSENARRLLGPDALSASSIVFLENGAVFTQSDAALRVARYLRPPWSVLAGLTIIPRVIRDAVYRSIARMRYRIFGKRACRVPDARVQGRFLP